MTPLERKIEMKGDFERNALVQALAQFIGGVEAAPVAGAVIDDDAAAAAGAVVNVAPNSTYGGRKGHLESTTAGNADTTFEVGAGGPEVFVRDNDTPGGVQLYFDEVAGQFLANLPAGVDCVVASIEGDAILVKHDVNASTNGAAVYLDDDAVNAHQKLLFVSPTDQDGAYGTVGPVTLDLDRIKNPTIRPQFEQETDGSITLYIVAA